MPEYGYNVIVTKDGYIQPVRYFNRLTQWLEGGHKSLDLNVWCHLPLREVPGLVFPQIFMIINEGVQQKNCHKSADKGRV